MFDSFRFTVSPAAALFYPLLTLCAEDWELLALLAAILVHEAGHIAAILLCRGHIRGAALELGGLRLDVSLPPQAAAEAFCALAGPAAGLLWAAAAARSGQRHWLYASGLSALLSLFNLLPCLPLDGGRAVLALTGREGLLRALGIVCAALLLWAGLHWRLYFSLLPALWLFWQQGGEWERL